MNFMTKGNAHKLQNLDTAANGGKGANVTRADLATAVFAALGKAPQIDYVDMPESLRKAYQYFTQADVSKLRAAGYTRPFTSLEDGVSAYVNGHLKPRNAA